MISPGHLTLGPDREGRLITVLGGTLCESEVRPRARTRSTSALTCGDGELRPGFVNAHTHIYSGLAAFGMPAALPPPRSFPEILEKIWWRLDRALDAQSLRAAARFTISEALRSGTTLLIDHHESPGLIEGSLDILADVCQELGIRALLCYGATERNGGDKEARRGLAECRRFAETNTRPLVRAMVGLHAGFTVSDETIREAGRLCRTLSIPLHLHVAEDACDIEDSRRHGHADPVARLEALDALPHGSILAHGVHLEPDAVRRTAKHGCWIVQNPRSNRANGVGYPLALAEGERVALGTDGFPSRMPEEAALLRADGLAHGEEEAMIQRRVEAGWSLAAERFGLPFAPLEKGGAADVAVVERGHVRHVMVGGRFVVRDGILLTGNLKEIRAEAMIEARRLWQRMAAL